MSSSAYDIKNGVPRWKARAKARKQCPEGPCKLHFLGHCSKRIEVYAVDRDHWNLDPKNLIRLCGSHWRLVAHGHIDLADPKQPITTFKSKGTRYYPRSSNHRIANDILVRKKRDARWRINREELAWAAGFFDGEGYIGCIKNFSRESSYRALRITVTQNKREPLDRFLSACGFGTIRICDNASVHSRHPRIVWEVSSFESVQATVALLWNWLSLPKQTQIKKALFEYHSTPVAKRIKRMNNL